MSDFSLHKILKEAEDSSASFKSQIKEIIKNSNLGFDQITVKGDMVVVKRQTFNRSNDTAIKLAERLVKAFKKHGTVTVLKTQDDWTDFPTKSYFTIQFKFEVTDANIQGKN